MSASVVADVSTTYAEQLAQRLGDRLRRVSLFGSRARGEEHPRSDYDLLVVLRHATAADRDVVHQLATEIELEHNVELSTKIVDQARFETLCNSGLPFWRRFADDERILWPPTSSPSG